MKQLTTELTPEYLVTAMSEAAVFDWQDILESLSPPPGVLGEAVCRIDSEIERLARLRGYLEMRYGNWCGDQGHKSGVKESNKLVRNIRKSLGYSYPRQGLTF